MTTTTHHATGTHCWSQLQTTDPEGARRFYSALFGWKAENTPVGPRSITIFRKLDKAVGAVMNEAQGPSSWMTFIAVDNADHIAERVIHAHGTLLMGPFTVESNGRMAVFQDSTGAIFAVWQAGSKGGAELLNEPDTMIWNELVTNDTNRAGQFYEKVFGWARESMTTPQAGPYTIFKQGPNSVGGMMSAPSGMTLKQPYWLVYFAATNCPQATAKAEKLGAKTMLPPKDIQDVGRIAILTDPQGAQFALIEPRPGQK